MIQTQTVASKLRFAIHQIDSLPPRSGVTPEHLILARQTLVAYLKQVEFNPEAISFSSFDSLSRLVVEYWPISLPAGEAIVAAEQALRKLVGK